MTQDDSTTVPDSAGYTKGDLLPASVNDTSAPSSRPISPSPASGTPVEHTFEEGHQANLAHHLDQDRSSRSRSRTRETFDKISSSVSRSLSRARESIAKDPFFNPGNQEEDQRQATLSQVSAALASTEAGKADRASRENSRTREFVKSVSRSVSRDPFFSRGEGVSQEDQIKATALAQVQHALDSTAAGNEDRMNRSKSRDASREGSRSGSRVRDFAKSTLGIGESTEGIPRGAAGLGDFSSKED
ncbi:hypothetical protein T439DRAFT_326308, partial [Meredithblackwellia eburnea MCA 4105]